eukprot:7348197-Alexandrium_andersonii.AAC.1
MGRIAGVLRHLLRRDLLQHVVASVEDLLDNWRQATLATLRVADVDDRGRQRGALLVQRGTAAPFAMAG